MDVLALALWAELWSLCGSHSDSGGQHRQRSTCVEWGEDTPTARRIRKSLCPIPLPDSHLLGAESPYLDHQAQDNASTLVQSPHRCGRSASSDISCVCSCFTPATLLPDTVALPLHPVYPDSPLCLLSVMGKSRHKTYIQVFTHVST